VKNFHQNHLKPLFTLSYSIYGFTLNASCTIILAEIFLTPCYLLTATNYVLPTLFFLNSIRYCTLKFRIVRTKIIALNDDVKQNRIENLCKLKKELNIIIKDHQHAIKLAEMLNESIQIMMLILGGQITASLCFKSFRFSIVSCATLIRIFYNA
jgi:7tm Odorant receptor